MLNNSCFLEHSGEKNEGSTRYHIAVCDSKILSLIMNGSKTIESRFSINRIAPFGYIEEGDTVYFKKTGGPVVGKAIAGRVQFFSKLTGREVQLLKEEYNNMIQADEEYWNCKMSARYGTLIYLDEVEQLSPIDIKKRDRRPWVICNNNVEHAF